MAFKRTTTKELTIKNKNTAPVIKAIGKKQITDDFLLKLSDKFSVMEWQKIKADFSKATGWVYQIISTIADKRQGLKHDKQ